MKMFLLSVLTLGFAAPVGAAGQCPSALTEPNLLKATCLHIDLSEAVSIRRVTTVIFDPKTVAVMPPLPQVDTVIREVAEVAK